MSKPQTNPTTYATLSGNQPASLLDNSLSPLYSAVNDLNTYSNVFTDSGAANAYVINSVAGLTASYTAGLLVAFVAANSNTLASTVNVFGLGVRSIVRPDGTALNSGDIVAGQVAVLMYNGGSFNLLNPSSAPASIGGVMSSAGLTLTNNAVTPNSKIDVTMAACQLRTTGSLTVARNNAFSGTLDLTVQGSNGRDQVAAFAASSTIHVYRAWDGASDVLIASASPPPTLANGASYPAGFNWQCYLGSFVLDGSGNLQKFYQRGERVFYQAPITLVTLGGASIAETTVSIAASVPSIAQEVRTHINGIIGLNAAGSTVFSTRIVTGVNFQTSSAQITSSGDTFVQDTHDLPYTGTTVRYIYTISTTSFGGAYTFAVSGYTVPNQAS